MTFKEILPYFQGVRMAGSNKAMCKCPAHYDEKQSLSIEDNGSGKILLHCFAGCQTEEIALAAGLQMKDLYYGGMASKPPWMKYVESVKKKSIEAYYNYTTISGQYAYTKVRMQGKDMVFGILSGDRFTFGLAGRNRREYKAIFGSSPAKIREAVSRNEYIFYAEGEKDVNTLLMYGYTAFTCGGANDWNKAALEVLAGAKVIILADNDEPGKDSACSIYRDMKEADVTAKILLPVADVPHADITDYFQAGHTVQDFDKLIQGDDTKKILKRGKANSKAKAEMVSMENIDEKEPSWLVPGYIFGEGVTTLAGDGGCGKTTVWCAIAAAISSGKVPFMVQEFLPFESKPEKVMFFSAEDSFEYTLRRRLRKNGAILSNIYSIDITDDRFKEVKFNSPFLGELLERYRPALCIFDPIQAFVPPDIRMGERNAMRNCLEPLNGYSKKYGTVFLIVVHSNKQSGVWGRKRIADSADIWDFSRSVLLAGETNQNGIRYISHEKSNCSVTGRTILYAIEDNVIRFVGYSDKKDRDFVTESDYTTRQAPQRQEAKEFILDFLKDGDREVSELDGMAAAMSIGTGTLKRAKADLKREGKIRTWSIGYGPEKKFYIRLLDQVSIQPQNK